MEEFPAGHMNTTGIAPARSHGLSQCKQARAYDKRSHDATECDPSDSILLGAVVSIQNIEFHLMLRTRIRKELMNSR
jgi:hypothetical protein